MQIKYFTMGFEGLTNIEFVEVLLCRKLAGNDHMGAFQKRKKKERNQIQGRVSQPLKGTF